MILWVFFLSGHVAGTGMSGIDSQPRDSAMAVMARLSSPWISHPSIGRFRLVYMVVARFLAARQARFIEQELSKALMGSYLL